jgi:hypothetical protein
MKMNDSSLHKNPSREQCQKVIKRILVTEVLEKGCNEHFKQASDFMNYFQSLYPASDALTKQVQRAIKAMDMPRDENGFYVVNKTGQQLEQEKELKYLFKKGDVSLESLDDCQPVFLKVSASIRSHLIYTLSNSVTFEQRFETIVETSNGIIFYTREKEKLLSLLNILIIH